MAKVKCDQHPETVYYESYGSKVECPFCKLIKDYDTLNTIRNKELELSAIKEAQLQERITSLTIQAEQNEKIFNKCQQDWNYDREEYKTGIRQLREELSVYKLRELNKCSI